MKHGYKSAARSLVSLVDTNLGKDEVDWIYNAVIIMSWQQTYYDMKIYTFILIIVICIK